MTRAAAPAATGPPSAFERAEFEQLYAKLERRIFNVLYRMLWDEAEAEDAMHEAFVKVWRGRARVEARTAESLVWQAAVNVARNRLRARRLWRWASLEPLREWAQAGGRPDEALQARSREAVLRAAVEALPEKLRSVVVLCELGELSYAEAGAALGVPEGTVASRRHQAVRRLRAALDEEEELDEAALR